MTRFLLFAFFLAGLSLPARAQMDLTLDQALAYTLDNNPGLLAARAELEATKELYPQAAAGWKPTLSGEGSIYKSKIDNSNFSGADGATTKEYGFDLEQPLYRGGRTTAETQKAESLIESAMAQLHRIEQDMLKDAALAYLSVVRDRKILDLREQNESVLEEEYTATKEKLDAGFLTITDLQQAEARLARARSDKIKASGTLEDSNARLAEIVGLTPGGMLYFPKPPANVPGSLGALIAAAHDQNPDIIAARYAFEAAEHDIDSAFSQLFPQLSAFASYDKQYDPQPGVVDESSTQTIGVRATIALYEGGLIRSRTRQARHVAEQRRLEIDDIIRAVESDITSQWQALQAALAEIEARKIESVAAGQARDSVREEARLGERTVLDILDVDQEWMESQEALIRARCDEMGARYALAATLGLLSPTH